jgi:hypothetical protein
LTVFRVNTQRESFLSYGKYKDNWRHNGTEENKENGAQESRSQGEADYAERLQQAETEEVSTWRGKALEVDIVEI